MAKDGTNRGRPLGAVAIVTREARALARATGELPHEILLRMAREHVAKVPLSVDQETGEIKYQHVIRDDEFRKDAAKAAAPYFAPRLSSVETIQGMSDDELDAIIRSAAAEAGVGLGLDGEGTEGDAPEDDARSSAPARPRRRISGGSYS